MIYVYRALLTLGLRRDQTLGVSYLTHALLAVLGVHASRHHYSRRMKPQRTRCAMVVSLTRNVVWWCWLGCLIYGYDSHPHPRRSSLRPGPFWLKPEGVGVAVGKFRTAPSLPPLACAFAKSGIIIHLSGHLEPIGCWVVQKSASQVLRHLGTDRVSRVVWDCDQGKSFPRAESP
jgi:hypothetical protein